MGNACVIIIQHRGPVLKIPSVQIVDESISIIVRVAIIVGIAFRVVIYPQAISEIIMRSTESCIDNRNDLRAAG